MKQTQNWRRLDGSPIRQDIRDEVRSVLVKEKQMGHAIKHFKSNDALKEAMGYIMGMGFEFKAKPHAFASSSCANKMVQ